MRQELEVSSQGDWAELELHEVVTPCPHHPLGAKGVGESPNVGSPPAIVNAVIDALSRFAPRITTPDMTSELEAEMSDIAGGRTTRAQVVEHFSPAPVIFRRYLRKKNGGCSRFRHQDPIASHDDFVSGGNAL